MLVSPDTFEKKREVAGKGERGVNKRRFEAVAPGFAACSLTHKVAMQAGRPNALDVASSNGEQPSARNA